MRRVLYLDVDMVLNDDAAHDAAAQDPNFQYDKPSTGVVFSHLLVGRFVGRVNQICLEYGIGSVEVVLCSELRRFVDLETLLRKSGFVGTFSGTTPVLPPTRAPGVDEHRALATEIAQHVRGIGHGRFVILTGEATHFPAELEECDLLESRTVRCENGITPEDRDKVIELFR